MLKLYRNAAHANSWVAYSKETGWVIFPARENGWEERRPARGLDPLWLREVPLERAANTGILETKVLHLV
jgi:hypothetical protein